MTRTSIGAYSVSVELPGEGDAFLVSSSTGQDCMLQLLAKPQDADGWEDAERETKIVGSLTHPTVNGAIETFWHEGKLAVVCAHHAGASVAQLLTKLGQLGQPLDVKAIAYLGGQIAGALEQAHSATDENDDFVRVCHGYLSPAQITIGWDGQVRLQGLGLASLVGVAGVKGVDGYIPPEQRGGGRITPRGDIYSLAAIIWALFAQKEPGAEQTLTVDGLGSSMGSSVPEPLREPMQRALETSLGKRKMTSMELEQWFTEVPGSSGANGSEAEGQIALAAAVEPLRKGTNLTGTKAKAAMPEIKTRPLGGKPSSKPLSKLPSRPLNKPPSRPLSKPLSKPGGKPGLPPRRPAIPGGNKLPPLGSKKAKLPPLRSKQRTLLGYSSEAGEDEGLSALDTPSPPLGGAVDWKTASDSAAGIPEASPSSDSFDLDDELSWGNGGEKLAAAVADVEDKRASSPGPATPTPSLIKEDDPDLVALDRAVDDAVESLSALQDPPSRLAEPLVAEQKAEGSPLAGLAASDTERPASPSPRQSEPPAELAAAVTSAAELPGAELPGAEPPGAEPPDAEPPDDFDEGLSISSTLASEAGLREAPPETALEIAALEIAATDAPDPDASATDASATDAPATDASATDAPDAGASDPAVSDPAVSDPAVSDIETSPWEDIEPAGVAKKPLSMVMAIAVTVFTAIGVMAIGVWWHQRKANQPLPGPSATATLSSAAPSIAKTVRPRGSTAATSKSPASVTGSPISGSTSATTASSVASTAPTASASAGGDGSNLPPNKGYLIVSFNGEQGGQVYFYTRAIGPVGAKLEVACDKSTFVRIGKQPGPRWLSQGRPLRVTCQSVTEVAMKP